MAFDPTKPQENTPLDAAQMRDQLNGLKDLFDAQSAQLTALQDQVTALQTQLAGKASGVTGVAALSLPFHDPVQATDMTPVLDKFNELLTALQQP